MFKLYTEKQMKRELDRSMHFLNRLDRIEQNMQELYGKLYRLEDHIFNPELSYDEAKSANDG